MTDEPTKTGLEFMLGQHIIIYYNDENKVSRRDGILLKVTVTDLIYTNKMNGKTEAMNRAIINRVELNDNKQNTLAGVSGVHKPLGSD